MMLKRWDEFHSTADSYFTFGFLYKSLTYFTLHPETFLSVRLFQDIRMMRN